MIKSNSQICCYHGRVAPSKAYSYYQLRKLSGTRNNLITGPWVHPVCVREREVGGGRHPSPAPTSSRRPSVAAPPASPLSETCLWLPSGLAPTSSCRACSRNMFTRNILGGLEGSKRPGLVANRATLPQKWPPPLRNVADSCELTATTQASRRVASVGTCAYQQLPCLLTRRHKIVSLLITVTNRNDTVCLKTAKLSLTRCDVGAKKRLDGVNGMLRVQDRENSSRERPRGFRRDRENGLRPRAAARGLSG